MASSESFRFSDPHEYQTAIQGGQFEIFPTSRGKYRADLTRIRLRQLWMQRARESAPRVYVGEVDNRRVAIGFLTNAKQPPMRHCGMTVSPGEIIVNDSRAMHRQTEAACDWGSLSLATGDLAAYCESIAGRQLSASSLSRLVRPSAALMSRLLKLHETIVRLASAEPDVLATDQIADALEQEMIRLMVRCLTEGESGKMSRSDRSHAAIMARFAEFLAANEARPLFLAEICVAIGTSERSLRVCCQEQLGIGPIRYLWLRRMHRARHALIAAAPGEASVTEIAISHGFWELGRFSVEYREMFGESPSVSLHGAAAIRRPDRAHSLSLGA